MLRLPNSSDSDNLDLAFPSESTLSAFPSLRKTESDAENERESPSRPGPSRPAPSSSPMPGPSRPPPSASPVPGPSRPPPSASPVPGPSRQGLSASHGQDFSPPESPVPGPSAARPDSSSSLDSFDPETHSWRYKNHKRRRVQYKSMNIRSESSESDEDNYDSYNLSPPTIDRSGENVVIENRTFKILLTKIAHSRHTNFSYSDHLYNMSFTVKKQSKFVLRSLFELLDFALTTALESIISHYPKTYENQIYTTVIQSGLLNGLNSGGYSLATPPKQIVSHVLNMLENYLQSNENLTLDSSFKVQFKVLSKAHVKHRIYNDPSYIAHVHQSETPGCSDSDVIPHHIFSFSSFCWKHLRDCFHNLCFSLTLILANIKLRYDEKVDQKLYPEILTCQSRKDPIGCEMIHNKLSEFNKKYQSTDWRSILMQQSKESNIQFHLFDADMNYTFIESVPEMFSFKYKPIYLCYFKNRTHITLILDYSQFCKKNAKFFCFGCKKYFKTKKTYQHRCKKINTCFACCRPIYNELFAAKLSDHFCDSESAKPHEIYNDICLKCNMSTNTKSCFESHKKVCSQGAKFYCCDRYLYKSSFTSQKELIDKHVCSQKKCHFCHGHYYEDLKESHQCTLEKFHPKSDFPKLGFIHLIQESVNGLDCYLCSQFGGCDFHNSTDQSIKAEPAHCTLYVPISPDSYEISQFSKYDKNSPKSETIILKQNQEFSNNSKKKVGPKMEQLKNKRGQLLFYEQILQFLLREEIQDVTFLCFSPDASSMLFLLNMFVSNGLSPKIINKSSSILLIDFQDLNLKFLNLINFLPFSSLNEIPHIPFFPLNFFSKASLELNLVPTKEMFYCFLDSHEVRQQKSDYFDSLSLTYANWQFKDELVKYSNTCINALIQQTYLFLNEARSFQKRAFSYYKKDFQFIHPFSEVTKNGYVFHLFQFLDLNDREIFAISKEFTGISDKTSKLEMEYVQYLESQFSNLRHAWSPYGQKRFQSCVPDCFDESNGVAYFFMGCYHHCHTKSDCTLRRKNWSDEKARRMEKEFNEKIEKLKTECEGIKQVVLQWECDWLAMRKHGKLREFLADTFVERPRKRLVPRDACESLLASKVIIP